ncbi:MAG: DUF3307 domain-containing protein [Spirochaetaceae bacterium]|nr:DUF3307 domain-containing protein [Spirochaetaceae bacterium]
MNYSIFFILLIGHFLGDFYFQTDGIARNKNGCKSKLIKHCLLYTLAMLIMILPVFSINLLICSLIISLIHFVVDLIKSNMKNREKNEVGIYLVDQVIHILVILGFSIFISQNIDLFYISSIRNLFDLFKVDDLMVLSVILSLLIINKPASITIKIVLAKYGSFTKEEKEGVPNTGALIGELERFIILLMLTQGQYAAIGFILTAKSIARYKKIVDEIRFSEYYLLGTFLSTLIVIITYLLVFSPFFS